MPDLDALLDAGHPPIVAILRGLDPDKALEVGQALFAAGIRIMEVPANSPRWQDSVARLVAECGDRALVGSGTITTPALADALHEAGGRLLVSPNCDPLVIARGRELGMDVMPGVMSATEAFAAIAAGAHHLKLFPAASVPEGHVAALLDVLPGDASIWAVGGINADNAKTWLKSGARGIGVGGAVFRPAMEPAEVERRARNLVERLGSAD